MVVLCCVCTWFSSRIARSYGRRSAGGGAPPGSPKPCSPKPMASAVRYRPTSRNDRYALLPSSHRRFHGVRRPRLAERSGARRDRRVLHLCGHGGEPLHRGAGGGRRGRGFPAGDPRRSRKRRGVDVAGVERASGKTFRWWGRYAPDLASRTTLDTQLNVFADFKPKLPAGYTRHPVRSPRQHPPRAPARGACRRSRSPDSSRPTP